MVIFIGMVWYLSMVEWLDALDQVGVVFFHGLVVEVFIVWCCVLGCVLWH